VTSWRRPAVAPNDRFLPAQEVISLHSPDRTPPQNGGFRLSGLRSANAGKEDEKRCYRRAYRRLRAGLRLNRDGSKHWSARETVPSYLEALAHGDERAACQRISTRAATTDLHRLAERYRVPTINPRDTSDRSSCWRISQRIGEAMTSTERDRFAARALGAVHLTQSGACVAAGDAGFPLLATSDGSYRVDGLRPAISPQVSSAGLGRLRSC